MFAVTSGRSRCGQPAGRGDQRLHQGVLGHFAAGVGERPEVRDRKRRLGVGRDGRRRHRARRPVHGHGPLRRDPRRRRRLADRARRPAQGSAQRPDRQRRRDRRPVRDLEERRHRTRQRRPQTSPAWSRPTLVVDGHAGGRLPAARPGHGHPARNGAKGMRRRLQRRQNRWRSRRRGACPRARHHRRTRRPPHQLGATSGVHARHRHDVGRPAGDHRRREDRVEDRRPHQAPRQGTAGTHPAAQARRRLVRRRREGAEEHQARQGRPGAQARRHQRQPQGPRRPQGQGRPRRRTADQDRPAAEDRSAAQGRRQHQHVGREGRPATEERSAAQGRPATEERPAGRRPAAEGQPARGHPERQPGRRWQAEGRPQGRRPARPRGAGRQEGLRLRPGRRRHRRGRADAGRRDPARRRRRPRAVAHAPVGLPRRPVVRPLLGVHFGPAAGGRPRPGAVLRRGRHGPGVPAARRRPARAADRRTAPPAAPDRRGLPALDRHQRPRVRRRAGPGAAADADRAGRLPHHDRPRRQRRPAAAAPGRRHRNQRRVAAAAGSPRSACPAARRSSGTATTGSAS